MQTALGHFIIVDSGHRHEEISDF